MTPGSGLPRLLVYTADLGSQIGTSDHDEHPRLAVLRARSVRCGFKQLLDETFVDVDARERPARALVMHNVEEPVHVRIVWHREYPGRVVRPLQDAVG